jgi:hypothetical protein
MLEKSILIPTCEHRFTGNKNDALAPYQSDKLRRKRKAEPDEPWLSALLSAGSDSTNANASDAKSRAEIASPFIAQEKTHQLLINEVAFALLISLAGLARSRTFRQQLSIDQDIAVNHENRQWQQTITGDCSDVRTAFMRFAWCQTATDYESRGTQAYIEERKMNFNPANTNFARKTTVSCDHSAAPETSNPFARRTLEIEANDTLVLLAERFFHDANIAWLIADLNRGNLRDDRIDGKRIVRVRLGQHITLPSWRDVALFYKAKGLSRRMREIVTIMERHDDNARTISTQLNHIVDSPPLVSTS